jgi:hypothetical protein
MNHRRFEAIALSLFTIALLHVAAFGQEKSRQSELNAVVEKAIKAHGGEETLAKLKGRVWKDKGIGYFGGKESSFTGSYAMQVPDQLKMELTGGFPFSLYFNRDKGLMNGKELTTAQIKQQQEGAYAGWVTTSFPLKEKTLVLALLEETVVNDRPVVGVKIKSNGHRDIDIYFDKETGLMAKVVTRVFGERESFWSAYRDFDGVPVPTKYVVKQNGKTLVEGEITEWRRADNLGDKTFMPAQPAPVSR